MFKFIKKYWLLILLGIIPILFIINKALETKLTEIPPSSPPTSNVASYKSLIPGESTENDVNNLLGYPVKVDQTDSVKIAEYKSTNPYRNHIVEFENKQISLIKEVVNKEDNKNADSIKSKYGLAPYILYNQYPTSTFNLYVYPKNGIAYLGHEDGTLLEIWYFKPIEIDEFINKWGKGYGKEKPKFPPKGY